MEYKDITPSVAEGHSDAGIKRETLETVMGDRCPLNMSEVRDLGIDQDIDPVDLAWLETAGGVPGAPWIPARSLREPDLRLAIAINERVRGGHEWFDEPDDLDRVESALQSIDGLVEPVEAAVTLAFRITRAQGSAEGTQENGASAG